MSRIHASDPLPLFPPNAALDVERRMEQQIEPPDQYNLFDWALKQAQEAAVAMPENESSTETRIGSYYHYPPMPDYSITSRVCDVCCYSEQAGLAESLVKARMQVLLTMAIARMRASKLPRWARFEESTCPDIFDEYAHQVINGSQMTFDVYSDLASDAVDATVDALPVFELKMLAVFSENFAAYRGEYAGNPHGFVRHELRSALDTYAVNSDVYWEHEIDALEPLEEDEVEEDDTEDPTASDSEDE